jgi:hypothetical protein
MRKPERHLSKNFRKPLNQGKNAASHQEQAQKDYEAFKEWIASGEANKPITAEELQRMLLLASKIK